MENTIVDEAVMANDLREQVFADKPEEKSMPDKDVIEAYIKDEKTILNAIYWANQFNEKFNGNSFTVKQVQKKTQFKDLGEALGVLQVMCLVGVCHSSDVRGEIKYKVIVDASQKVLLLKKEKERMEAEKVQAINQVTMRYDMKIASLNSQIEKLQPVALDEKAEEQKI